MEGDTLEQADASASKPACAAAGEPAPLLLTIGDTSALGVYADNQEDFENNDLVNIDIIRAEEASKPYIGDREALDNLKQEYLAGSPVFVVKITQLEASYSWLRRTRGDGNCFFRSFIFGYLEHMLTSEDEAECKRFLATLEAWKAKLEASGFQVLVFEDALDVVVNLVNAIIIGPQAPGGLDHDALVSNFRDDTTSNYIVMLLRLITSCEIQTREAHFLPFIMGTADDPSMTAASFCHRHVEPMGEESDHIHAQALTDALGVRIRVMYLDSSVGGGGGGDTSVGTHDFEPQGSWPPPLVHMLYRPGHYDILYPA